MICWECGIATPSILPFGAKLWLQSQLCENVILGKSRSAHHNEMSIWQYLKVYFSTQPQLWNCCRLTTQHKTTQHTQIDDHRCTNIHRHGMKWQSCATPGTGCPGRRLQVLWLHDFWQGTWWRSDGLRMSEAWSPPTLKSLKNEWRNESGRIQMIQDISYPFKKSRIWDDKAFLLSHSSSSSSSSSSGSLVSGKGCWD